MGLLMSEPFQQVNALKNVLRAVGNGASALIFAVFAQVDWLVVALLAGGAIVGGQIGAKVGRRLPAGVLRAVIVIVGVAVVHFALTGLPGLSDPLGSVDWSAIDPGSWAAVVYSTVFASGFAIAAWQANVSRIGANKVLVYMYVVTLVGLAAGVALLGEGLGAGKLAGAAVILLGVYLARRS